MLGLADGTSTAVTDHTAEPTRSAIRVQARAMDAVAPMQPSWNLGNTLDAIPLRGELGQPEGEGARRPRRSAGPLQLHLDPDLRTFRDEPRTLLVESVNEPQFENATAQQKAKLLHELHTSFHKIVRSSGGRNTDRLLVLTAKGCTPSQPLMDDLYSTIKSGNDRNLVATVHYYSCYPFSVNIAGGTHYDDAAQNDLNDAFARIGTKFQGLWHGKTELVEGRDTPCGTRRGSSSRPAR